MSSVRRKVPRIQVFTLLLGLLAPVSVATPAAAIYGGKPSIDNPFVVGLLSSEIAETAGQWRPGSSKNCFDRSALSNHARSKLLGANPWDKSCR